MDDMIKREDVLQALIECDAVTGFAYRQMEEAINAIPSAIVRCDECKHGEYRVDHDDYLCRQYGVCVHDAEWYCADGEREGE